jgi:ComF family protein
MFLALLQRAQSRMPSQCTVCKAWPSQPVCEACVVRFAQPTHRCATCALRVPAGVKQCGACLLNPPQLDACLAAVSYDYPWAGLVTRFKFRNQPGLGPLLAGLILNLPQVEQVLDDVHLLIPMPLSRQRLQTRGYNQALLLARCLRPHKADARVLLRIRDTPAQSAQDRAHRLSSLAGAFAVDPLLNHRLDGKRVVLVDDVMTTGASLHGAALALRAAGAARVTAMVVARTE